jgi:hypothetical protein
MERMLRYNNKDYSIDEWCNEHLSDKKEYDFIEALQDLLNDYPELKIFKAQLRSMILSWKREHENILNNENEKTFY